MRTSLSFIKTIDELMVHIGLTKDVTKHLDLIREISPIEVYNYGNVQYVLRETAVKDRQTLLETFAEDLHHGSWFNLSQPLRQAVDALLTKPVNPTREHVRTLRDAGCKWAFECGMADRASEIMERHNHAAKRAALRHGFPAAGNAYKRFRDHWKMGWETSDNAGGAIVPIPPDWKCLCG